MPRPLKYRRINWEPGVTYFKPRGIPMNRLEEVTLTMDQSEAIRLKYVKDMDQVDCAKKMNISQSTFQRILHSANKKIAEAIISGKAIKIEGGNIRLPSRPLFQRGFRQRRRRHGNY